MNLSKCICLELSFANSIELDFIVLCFKTLSDNNYLLTQHSVYIKLVTNLFGFILSYFPFVSYV